MEGEGNVYSSKRDNAQMECKRCGDSGNASKVSLGLWHNFGDTANYENMKKLYFLHLTMTSSQFDLANNYTEPALPRKTSAVF